MSQSKSNKIRRLVRRLMGAEVSSESAAIVPAKGAECTKSDQMGVETSLSDTKPVRRDPTRRSIQSVSKNRGMVSRLVYDPVAKCIRLADPCDPDQTHPKITCSDMHVD